MTDLPPSRNHAPGEPIRSDFAGDPDMSEIVEMFVAEIPSKLARLTDLWRSQKFDELRRTAHQLKGASGGYGFPQLGDAAGKLEHLLNELSENGGDNPVADLRAQFEALVNMCSRVTS